MPRAGWCRECGEWVWVDPQGACQNGHSSECVGGIYDAEENLSGVEPGALDFGVGDFPSNLDRFNWGAFLLPLPWGVGFGAWTVVLLWMLMTTVPLTFAMIVGSFGEDALAANLLLVSLVGEVISGGIRLWIGASATRMLWAREQQRLKVVEGAKPRFGVSSYLARQAIWTRVGIGLTVLMIASLALLVFSTDPTVASMMEKQGITSQDAALSAFWLMAEAGLGLWLAAKMRQEGVVEPPPAQEM